VNFFDCFKEYMAQTVLPQLQEISEDLLAQEKSLIAQLAEVQEKLQGVRAILPLFGESADAAEVLPVKAPAKEKTTASKTASKKAPKAEKKAAPVVEKKAAPVAEKKTKATVLKAKPAAKASTKKNDGRAASWQKYTRPGVGEQSIPDAVRLVLETQPDKSFKIAEVMDALFSESMPKSQHLKARNRISNVLSGGVRSGDWYKGDRGTYRLTAD